MPHQRGRRPGHFRGGARRDVRAGSVQKAAISKKRTCAAHSLQFLTLAFRVPKWMRHLVTIDLR